MNKASVIIGGKEYTLLASVWTWIEYKRIFGRDWQSDRNMQISDIQSVLRFQADFGEPDEDSFKILPEEKKAEYWRRLKEISVDSSFMLDTIYAMAVAGGFKGTRRDVFETMSPSELDACSELMQAYAHLVEEFVPSTKKKS